MKHLSFSLDLPIVYFAVFLCLTNCQKAHAQEAVQDTIWQTLNDELEKKTVQADSTLLSDTVAHASYDSISSKMKWSLPLVFNAEIPIHLNRDWNIPETAAKVPDEWKIPFDNVSDKYVDSLRAGTYQLIALNRIDLACFDAAVLPKPEKIEIEINATPKEEWKMAPTKQIDINMPTGNVPTQKDFNYSNWKFVGHLSAQASQTYISPNWASGGNTNSSILLSAYATAKYDDRKLIQFDNVFDLQLGFNTNASDTLRAFSVGTDQLQISSKLGIKAFNKWYYSLQAELITQMADNFKPNTTTLKSSFLSPAKLFVSLGLDYKLSTSKLNLSVLLTPFTYKLNYVRESDKIDPTSYGIEEGKHFGHEFGIKLSSTFNWNIADNISWSSYIYYYSNFGYIDSEWKNTFNFAISRFFTAQVFLHTKYDDRIKRKEEQKTLFQFKDIISVGFTYHFPSFRFQ